MRLSLDAGASRAQRARPVAPRTGVRSEPPPRFVLARLLTTLRSDHFSARPRGARSAGRATWGLSAPHVGTRPLGTIKISAQGRRLSTEDASSRSRMTSRAPSKLVVHHRSSGVAMGTLDGFFVCVASAKRHRKTSTPRWSARRPSLPSARWPGFDRGGRSDGDAPVRSDATRRRSMPPTRPVTKRWGTSSSFSVMVFGRARFAGS